jgi:hypothetical protein
LQKEESGLLIGKDEMESGSGSEQVEEQPPKKKRYHRHTSRQIQEMEAYITPLSLILQTNYKETVNINFI